MDSTGVGTSIMAQVLFFPQYLFVLILLGQEPIVVLTLWSLLAALFGLGLAIGVVIAVKLIIWNKNEIICCRLAFFSSFKSGLSFAIRQVTKFWQNNSIQYFTLHRVIDYWKCIMLIDPQLDQLIQVLRTGSEKKLITGWLPLVLDLSGRTMLVAGTTWNRCWLLCFNAQTLQVLHIMGRLQLFWLGGSP